MFTIQVATADETTEISDLVNRAYTKWIEVMGGKPRPMTADYNTLIAEQHVFSAREGTELVGVLVIWHIDDALYIDNLAVAPSHQGQGIGHKLLNFAEQKVRELNLNTLTLMTNVKMEYNQAYYRKYGFTETRREMMSNGRSVVWMAKQL